MKRNSRFFTYIKEWLFPKDEKQTSFAEKEPRFKQFSQLKENDIRVIHQYPKKTDFPFPVVKDDEPLGQIVERNKKKKSDRHQTDSKKTNPSISSQKNDDEPPQEEAKSQFFQGRQFSYQKSPSPIYGYKIQTYKSEEMEESPGEEEFEWGNEHGSLEKVEHVPKETRRIEQETDSIHVDEIEDISVDCDSKEEVIVEAYQEKESVSNVIDMHQRIVNNEKTSEIIDESKNDRSSVGGGKEHEVEEIRNQEKIKQESEKHASYSSKDPGNESSTTHTTEKINKKINTGENNVPFNVMMFKRDRIKEERKKVEREKNYVYPGLHLLDVPPKQDGTDTDWMNNQVHKLNETFQYFNIGAKVVHVTEGPTVTRFEIQPEPGVKVSKITNLSDDIKLSLAAKDIRMEAPIPGKNTIGIEVPNSVSRPVYLRQVLHHSSFRKGDSPLTVGLGMDISGTPVVTDLQKMPHGLIAGATGSGKSVCVNSILVSLLYKASPKDVRLLLIDPKVVELAPYNNIPHLAYPVITDPKEATEGLKWAVSEMERRYELFAKFGTRDIKRYNEKMKARDENEETLPYIVVVVDELADLMMVAPHDVEEAICRIAQKARACGIHLLVATQRPSVDVITGLIKANIPTRIAFSVSAQTDSRTILDSGGAERLLGKGDMLFLENGSGKPVRIQGTFVSDDEIDRVMEHAREMEKPNFLFEKETLLQQVDGEAEDDLFEEACHFVCENEAASASLLQRHFRIGYNRAARMIDEMEMRGIISEARGSKAREVYLTKEEINERIR